MIWEGLSEPVQVVWRHAPLVLEEVTLDPTVGDIAEQLKERFHPRRYRLDVRQAPMMRLVVTHDQRNHRWMAIWLVHHLCSDHITLEAMQWEAKSFLAGLATNLATPFPFRDYVAQIRLGSGQKKHEVFFREMLGAVEEPTAPFGLVDVYGDGSAIVETRSLVDLSLSHRLRRRARALRVSTASLFHVAWAQLLARASGKDNPVFGTVLFGRMQGGDSVRALQFRQGAHIRRSRA